MRITDDRSFRMSVDGRAFSIFDADEVIVPERAALAAAVQVYDSQQPHLDRPSIGGHTGLLFLHGSEGANRCRLPENLVGIRPTGAPCAPVSVGVSWLAVQIQDQD